MDYKVEKLNVPKLCLGEGPHWSVRDQSLYFIDIDTSTIYRYHPASDTCYSVLLDVPTIGFVTPIADNKVKFLIGAGTSLFIVKWDGVCETAASLELLHVLTGEPSTNRINDGKCDPFGRAWFGTMRIKNILTGRVGSFFSYGKDKGCQKHFTEVGLSNGLAWDLSKNRMYYIDTLRFSVDAVDYETNGKISNRRVIFDLKKNKLPYYPDGMTIDTDGNLWVACCTGSQVIQINPDSGQILQQVDLPTPYITSCAWGGKNLDELYVTSASVIDGGLDVSNDPDSGGVFRVTGLSARGLPMTDFILK